MLRASFLPVRLRLRARMTMTLSPCPTRRVPSLSLWNRRNPNCLTAGVPLKKAGIFMPPTRRLQSVIASANGAVVAPSSSTNYDWRHSVQPLWLPEAHCCTYYRQQSSHYSANACERLSDEESDQGVDQSSTSTSGKGTSTLDNVNKWKSKFSMLLRNKSEQECVSREKKDRRDYEQIATIAKRMGLYSRQYATVVVFSKLPLPNYRPDLDDKRPLRELSIPIGLQKEVDSLLKDYLTQKRTNPESFPNSAFSRSSSTDSFSTNEGFFGKHDTEASPSVVMQKILRRRSLQLRNQQATWQESAEGQKMLEFRRNLPSFKEKKALLEVISGNQVVVVSGETGCGKTTQLPQYILESEIDAARGSTCSIICTQPRRISAMSVAERVATERGEKLGESVGYKVRLEGIKGRDTRLLFCTTGILLRRLLVDRCLRGVTHVIVDEIHERGMNEDFLLIVLKDILPHRPNLKLILMSATLNAELFSSYFSGAPMMHIPGFTYPVRTHFLENVLEITGHKLTPTNQIDDYGQEKSWKMQKQTLIRKRKTQIASSVEEALKAADFRRYSSRVRESLACWNPDSIGFNLIENVLVHICQKERPGAILVFMMGWDDINSLKEKLQVHPILGDPIKVLILPCHGSMASSEQKLIFNKPENGERKIVLATNMAETSITINDAVFVVDCGKAKETSYDALNNTPCLLPTWISKASARQRRGRAGRVQPGECYHLFPRCVYDGFSDYKLPELLRTPLQSLCLQIKMLRLGSISEFLSRALQSPEDLTVQNAIGYLKVIGALDDEEELTNLGRHLAVLPVEPKLGKMLILGAIFKCLDPILTIVSGLSLRDPFISPFDKRELAESAKSRFSCRDYSDHLTLVRAYEGWKDAKKDHSGNEYCWDNFLSVQTLEAIDSLRKQFHFVLKGTGFVNESLSSCHSSRDEKLIRAVICAGLFPGICSVVNKKRSITLKTKEDGKVMLYSSSVNGKEAKIPYPWLVFNGKVKVNSVFIRDSTAISDSVLLLFGGNICRGGLDGHLKMLAGHLEFFMEPDLASTYLTLKKELDELIINRLENPRMNTEINEELLHAIQLLLSEDPCSGRFVFSSSKEPKPKKSKSELKPKTSTGGSVGDDNPKGQLQTMLTRAGHGNPSYKTKQLKNNKFTAMVEFNGMQFNSEPSGSKKQAEKTAASAALEWLIGEASSASQNSDHLSVGLKKSDLKTKKMKSPVDTSSGSEDGGENAKNQLQTMLTRAGHGNPSYKTKKLNNNQFRAVVEFNGKQFISEPSGKKKQAEMNAASAALEWLIGEASSGSQNSDHLSVGLKKSDLKTKKMKSPVETSSGSEDGGENSKNQLQTMLTRAGHDKPSYKTKKLNNNHFRAMVEFNGMQFISEPTVGKKQAEMNAASAALEWLIGESSSGSQNSDHLSSGLMNSKLKNNKMKSPVETSSGTDNGGGDNPKNQLQTMLSRAGHVDPSYKTKKLKNKNLFVAMLEFNGMQFVSQPFGSKKQAEKSAASAALEQLIGGATLVSQSLDHLSTGLKKSKEQNRKT